MYLGRGRSISPPKPFELAVWALPGFGGLLYPLFKRQKRISTDKAMNPFQMWIGRQGSGKTNLARLQIKNQIKKGLGGLVLDGKEGDESLCNYTIQLLAEMGADPEDVFINDYFHPYGHPMQDYLYDDKKDGVSWFEIVEELVSATAQISLLRSSPGARELSMARMTFIPMMLADIPLSDISLFLTNKRFREGVVEKVKMPQLENFWLGEQSYFSKLPRDVLESTRNKWDILTYHPAIAPCISERDKLGEFAQLTDFMARGGWWIQPLSERRFKFELRMTLAQLVQYKLKVAALARQDNVEKPYFYCWLDEYPQYRSKITHDEVLKLARSQHIGLIFLCQGTEMFSDEELRGLAACATKGVFSCERESGLDMCMQIFQPEGKQAKDWEGKTLYSVRDEIDNYLNLVMSQKTGEAIVRIDPDTQPYFLNVPLVKDPKCSPELEKAFRLAVAKRWYRPRK